MNKQEAIQLLEEMGIDEAYRCPSCNEILIHKIKKVLHKDGKQTLYRCTHCGMAFRIIICRICHKKRSSYALGICMNCFKKSKLSRLTQEKEQIERNYNKFMLITCRSKPDIKFSVKKFLYNKIKLFCIENNITKAEFVRKAIDEKLSRSRK